MEVKLVSFSENQPAWHGIVFSEAERERFMLRSGSYHRRDGFQWTKIEWYSLHVPNKSTLQWLWDNVGDDRYTYWNVDRARLDDDLPDLRQFVETWYTSFELVPPERRNWMCFRQHDNIIAFRDPGHAALFKLTFA